MLLVLPVAGNSLRFPEDKPKWLLRHPTGDIMLLAGLRGISDVIHQRVSHILVIMLEEHVQRFPYATTLVAQALRKNYPDTIVQVASVKATHNQPETVKLGLETFLNEFPIAAQRSFLIKDCDNYWTCDRLPDPTANHGAVLYGRLADYPGVTAQDKSYIQLGVNDHVISITEKRVVSETFCTGYMFNSAERYIEQFVNLPMGVQDDTRLYLSDVIYNDLLQGHYYQGVEVGCYQDWGTSEKWQLHLQTYSTLFVDLDGTLWENTAPDFSPRWDDALMIPLPDNVAFLKEMWRSGRSHLVLTTSRTEEYRHITERQLTALGISYHTLVMGLPHNSPRVVVNDSSSSHRTALSYTVQRNWDGQLRQLLEGILTGKQHA